MCVCVIITNIFYYRKLQEDLTDEMVELAKQLKESSLVMSHSIQNTEKVRPWKVYELAFTYRFKLVYILVWGKEK